MGLLQKLFKGKQAKVDYLETTTRFSTPITTSIIIYRPTNVVWEYFVEPRNWVEWWGGAMKSAQWQKDGVIEWDGGSLTTVADIIPKEMVKLSDNWIDHRITFVSVDQEITEFGFTDIAKNSSFGASYSYDLYMRLKKFKELIENN